MKTLRLLRNIAALFIVTMALVPGSAKAVSYCFTTSGATNCTYNGGGNCQTNACTSGQPCSYTACSHKLPKL